MMVSCPNCDSEIEENIKFCKDCGSNINTINSPLNDEEETISPKFFLRIPKGTKFCIDWGTRIKKIKMYTPQEIICPQCSYLNPEGTKFCTDCGTKLEEVVFNPDQEMICPKCALKLSPMTRFCPECGTKFEQYSPPTPETISQDNPINEDAQHNVNQTGKNILNYVVGLFKKFKQSPSFHNNSSSNIDDSSLPETVPKLILTCTVCGSYYELQKDESPDDFESCQCGGKLKYQLKQEQVQY